MLDGSVDLLEACVASIIRSVQGAPDGESLLDVSELARRGNPFPFIADRWPGLVITDPDEARYFQGSLHDPENPCLRLDDWQRDLLRCVFDEEYFSIVVKGNTKAGKGMVTALAINIWWDVYDRSKVVVTSSSADHAKANLFAEVVKWRRAMRPGSAGPGRVLTEALLDNDQHYVRVSNPLTGEGFCHDDQTEVMTNRGWVAWADVDDADLFLSMDPVTHEASYHPATAIVRRKYHGEMCLYQERGADFCVTPNHRMFAYRPSRKLGRVHEFLTLGQMPKRVYVPRGVSWNGIAQQVHVIPRLVRAFKYNHNVWPERRVDMNAWLIFLGWYFSDGCLSKRNGSVSIYQSKPQTVPAVRAAIKAAGFDFSEENRGARGVVFTIVSRQLCEHLAHHGYPKRNRRVPSYVRTLSRQQIKLFVDAFAGGDGFWQSKNRRVVYGTYKGLIDDVHELAILAGYQSFVELRRVVGDVNVIDGRKVVSRRNKYVLSLHGTVESIRLVPSKVTKIKYNGMVYCATVPPHHLLFTRRNGKTMWSGNSGQHGPRTLFAIDECSAIDAGRVDDAEKQARKIVALGNPRSATGWLWQAFRLASPVDETQDVPTALGKRRCITVDGARCMNVKNKRLEKPQSPPGGIEIDGEYYPALTRIPPDAFAKVKPLIPDQCDYGRFVGIQQHPDSRHVAVFAHGKFPTEDPQKQVVLPSWIGRHVLAWNRSVPVTCFAFDAARSLDGDESVLAAGSSVGCAWLDGWKMADAIYHGERILEKALEAGVDLRKGRNPVCVDMDGGYGAGTADWLRRQNVWVIEYRGNDASDVDPRTYANRRAEGYGELGRRLSPDDVHKDEPWCLPADAQMHEDLAAGEKIYDKRDGLRFRLEPKDNIKIKLGRSPDRGDAVVMLYYAVTLFGKFTASSRTGASLVLWPPMEAVAEAEAEDAAERRWWNS